MKKIKLVLLELLLILLSALLGGVVGLLFGMIYGGNYGFEGIFGSGYEGAGLLGLLLGVMVLVAMRVYFWFTKLRTMYFVITLGSFLVSSVIAHYLFYLQLSYGIGKLLSVVTILIILFVGLLIPTFTFMKMKGRK